MADCEIITPLAAKYNVDNEDALILRGDLNILHTDDRLPDNKRKKKKRIYNTNPIRQPIRSTNEISQSLKISKMPSYTYRPRSSINALPSLPFERASLFKQKPSYTVGVGSDWER